MRYANKISIVLSIVCLVNPMSWAMRRGGSTKPGSIAAIHAQKEEAQKKFATLLQQLPDNFDAAFTIIKEAATNKQWIHAEVATLVTKLFNSLCVERISDNVINQKLEQLATLTQLPETVASITKNCRLFILRRETASRMGEINSFIAEWQQQLDSALKKAKYLTEVKAQGQASIEPLKAAVKDENITTASKEYTKLKEWGNVLETAQTKIDAMYNKQTDELAQLAIQIEKTEITPLIQNTNKLSTALQKENNDYQTIQQQLKKLRPAALTKANALNTTTQKEIDTEAQRHATNLQQQKTMAADLASQMSEAENSRHVTEQTRLIAQWDAMNQWREIAGKTILPYPQELMQ